MVSLKLIAYISAFTAHSSTSDFDLGNACAAFEENQIQFRRNFLNTSGGISATLSSIQDDGSSTWLCFCPRVSMSSASSSAQGEVACSLFYARIPTSLKGTISTWKSGDFIRMNVTLRNISATFKDKISIGGSLYDGNGYISGGTYTVKTLVWSFQTNDIVRLKTIGEILKEQERANAADRKRYELEAMVARMAAEKAAMEHQLEHAIREGNIDLARVLIAQGVRADSCDGVPLLHTAVRGRAYRSIKLLLGLPFTDINQEWKGETALSIARSLADFSIIELLKSKGAN